MARLVSLGVALHALCGLLALAFVHVLGDRWWPATLFLFGPRWVVLVPAAVLLPAGVAWARRALAVELLLVPLLALFVLDFRVPWRLLLRDGEPSLRVLTLNVANMRGATDDLVRLIDDHDVDVVVLQEWRPAARGARGFFAAPGWHVVGDDAGRLVASRFPVKRGDAGTVESGRGGWMEAEVTTPEGSVTIVNVHLDTPRPGINAVFSRGIDGGEKFDRITSARRAGNLQVSSRVAALTGVRIVAGDFNTPVESPIYGAHWGNLANAISEVGLGLCWTKRTRTIGVRIDHILVSEEGLVLRAWVGPRVGSDHRPVVADVMIRRLRSRPQGTARNALSAPAPLRDR